MATGKETAKKDDAAEASAAPPTKSKKLLFIIIGIAVLCIGAGAGLALMLAPKAPPADTVTGEAPAAKKPEKKEEKKDIKPPVFVPLDPFTVNLQPGQDNSEQFLQMVVSLRVIDDKTGEQVKGFMPEIRHEILNLAGSRRAAEITTPEGKEYLAEDIQDVVNEVLGFTPPKRGRRRNAATEEPAEPLPVQAVFFTQFIVQ